MTGDVTIEWHVARGTDKSELVIELETFTETGKMSTDRRLVQVKRLPVAGHQLVVAPFVAK